jgi:hypothetical protein
MRSIRLIALLFAAAFLYSCDENEEQIVNQAPVNRLQAKAGPDQQVQVNATVVLDGQNSKDGNGKPFEYRWTLKSKPAGSIAVIENEKTPSPELTPELAGTYVVELKIVQGSFTSTDEISIRAIAEEPAEDLPIILSEDFNEDLILEDVYEEEGKADYLVTDLIRINAQLEIRPGVIIEFEKDKGLQVNQGKLIAIGNAERKIVFTGVEKERGFWKGILIFSNSFENELDHVVVAYGGGSPFLESLDNHRANIFLSGSEISGAALKISNSEIAHSGEFGLYVNGLSTLTGFEANDFYWNAGNAVFLPAREVRNVDAATTFSFNGFNGIETGGVIGSLDQSNWEKLANGNSYLISSDLLVQSGWSIQEGAVLEFRSGTSLTVASTGYLSAIGTEAEPIVFTNHAGGGYWKGMLFDSGSEYNKLSHVEVSYAGSASFGQVDDVKANIAVSGTVVIEHSEIHHGNGWGIVVANGVLNTDAATNNVFYNLQLGDVKLPIVYEPVDLTGDWMDWWSVVHDRHVVTENYYDRATGTWFGGAADPWAMTNAGFGLKIKADGKYVWTIAEPSPMTGCPSYSAEHFTGTVQNGPNQLTFIEESWRSKFYFSCDESQNVDMEVQPGQMTLPAETLQETHFGKKYDVLKMYSGGSSFKYYRLRQ